MNNSYLILSRFLLSFILIGTQLNSYAQEIQWSTNQNIVSGDELKSVHFSQDSLIYVIKTQEKSPKTVNFDVFNFELEMVQSSSASLDLDELHKTAIIQNNLYIFGTKYHQKEDELIAFQVNQKGEVISTNSLLKCQSNGGYHASFDIAISDNHTMCAVIGTDGYYDGHKEIIHGVLFGEQWKELQKKDILTGIEIKKKVHNVLTVNNKGTLYILKRERQKAGDKYFVFSMDKSGHNSNHEIHLKTRNIVDMRYELDTLGNLYLAGFYAPPYRSYYEGIYVKKLNDQGDELFSKEYLFNENVVDAFHSKKEIKEHGYGLSRFRANDFHFINGKLMVLDLEQHQSYMDKGNKIDSRKGFITIGINEKGGFLYATPVITDQTDEINGGYWGSHYHLVYNEEHFVYLNIYGDGAKSVKEDLPENAASYVFKLTFDDNGVEHRELQNFNVGLSKYALQPKINNKTDLPIIVLESENHDQYAIGMLK